MAWMITEIDNDEARDTDLTDGELIGISVILINYCGEPHNNNNVYFRAWEKIQYQVKEALENG